MAKTFIPTLVAMVKAICLYITRYGSTLKIWIPEDKWVYLDALNQACVDFVTYIEPLIPEGE